ncbi:MAG: helix-turn-helix domain-containing protein [Janthinobacterium lividum]
MREFLTSEDVAIRLSVTRQHVARLVKQGKLPGVARGRRLLFPLGAWDEFVAELEAAAKANLRGEGTHVDAA